jgi:hypothetical protein
MDLSHRRRESSGNEMPPHGKTCGDDKPVWCNGWECFNRNVAPVDTIDLARSGGNQLVRLQQLTKVHFLARLKPTYNSESEGFGLGFWRPLDT